MTRLEKYLLKNPMETKYNLPQKSYPEIDVRSLLEVRRRARLHQRWAIALCLIGSVILFVWEVW